MKYLDYTIFCLILSLSSVQNHKKITFLDEINCNLHYYYYLCISNLSCFDYGEFDWS